MVLCSSSSSLSPLFLLKVCKNVRNLEQVHAQIIRQGSEQDHFLVAQFISVCNSVSPNHLPYVSTIFDRLIQPNIYLWNTLIKCHCTHSSLATSIKFFRLMKQKGYVAADKYTFPSLVKACSGALALREGQVIHGMIVKYGTEADLFVGSSLIDLYGKCREMVNARKVFDGMPVRNVVSWTCMIVGYSTDGNYSEAKKLFDEMPQRNHASWNAMINGFVKSGDLVSARMLFDEMPGKNAVSFTTMMDGYAKSGDMAAARCLFDGLAEAEKDTVSWSAMIGGYAQNGQCKEAIRAFGEMRSRKVKADGHVMASLISACSQAGDWELAEGVEMLMGEEEEGQGGGMGNVHVAAALVNMYAKCGNLERAESVFEGMPTRDLFSYSAMIQGYSVHGSGGKAVALFRRMVTEEGLAPDGVAVTAVLSACCAHDIDAGLVAEGCRLVVSMMDDYSLAPWTDHYACIVHLLGRAGMLREAYRILETSPPMRSHAAAWGALLAACRTHADVSLGEKVAARLFKTEPLNAANYVLLSDLYAASGQWSHVNRLRNQMRQQGIRKLPGCSWIR